MTISSSLNAGVAGLNVNATKLATISDNIANSGTFGYKRAEAEFSSLVVSSQGGSYTAGGVRVASRRDVEANGALVTTENPLDIAVAGRGMLPVTTVAAVNAQQGELPLLLTSTGSFRPDDEGVLKTSSGLVLLGWPADADGNIPPQPRNGSAGLEPVNVFSSQFATSPTTKIWMGANLPATATQAGASGDTLDIPIEYFDNVGASQTLLASFTPTVPASGASNTWTLSFDDSATPAALNPVAEFTIVFDDTRGSGGSILSVTPVSGGTFDATTGELSFNVDGGPMTVEIGVPGTSTLLTQLSAEFAPTSVVKNGNEVGTLSGVEIDENGFLNAIYDSGFTKTIYQIPLADVPNLNGLKPESAQAFSVTANSGSLYLWDAGDGPTGSFQGYALEESTTDIANELTHLIQTQRAYSSNAKVIQTVDEMLQETTNIKR
ncbi:flagellar hook protein FlgE [Oceanicella actignis]|uniref:Flagellar hook protein FlgE n=1 Tax=Oceanicella actignis TaxID=1189325 RepID=A0A1M7T643_9RHOB|nr:flagellar hook protein FlgE [Oceanicella actignis]TYO84843.1 flagellar hook protein FlgE [Oceanicella actignis]SET44114.1 flagellar hook protein FlgE [Oceanicella actignis]SHN66169.1 flagellar hook protein FlgE [Oceanicella actignis]